MALVLVAVACNSESDGDSAPPAGNSGAGAEPLVVHAVATISVVWYTLRRTGQSQDKPHPLTEARIEQERLEAQGRQQASGSSARTHIAFAPMERVSGATKSSAGPRELARLVRAAGVRDARVLEAVSSVPRAAFVPPERLDRAYRDEPIEIPHGQVTTQPSLVARMLEALTLEGWESVLEVGTGYGFQTALLTRLAGEVISVERFADLAAAARDNLASQGITGFEILVADGSRGLPARAPFDAILVSAAFTRVPPPLVEQLAPSGRLVQPIGPGGHDEVVLFERASAGLERRRSVTPAHFVKLYGADGFAPREY